MILGTYIKQSCFIAIAMLIFGGCTSNNGPKVIVELTYNSASSSAKLYYANVISGGDKFHWYGIFAGKKETITLYPGERSYNTVTLFYQLSMDKPKQVWEGPEFLTELGYRIHITIHESGKITERSCNLPCDLNS